MNRILLVTLLSLIIATIKAQSPFVHNFTKKTYKGGTQNWDISQGSNSWLYIANKEGLLQFDGQTWRLTPISNYTNIRSVLCCSNGRIYAGAFNEFGYYQYQKNGLLQYHSLRQNSTQAIQVLEVWNIHEASSNKLFFQTDNSILKVDNDSIKELSLGKTIICSAFVHQLLLVATPKEGVYMLQGDIFVKLPESKILDNKRIKAILPINTKELLLVSEFDGCFIFDGSKVTPYQTPLDYFLKENQLFCAAISEEWLAFGTVSKGLAIMNRKSSQLVFVNKASGLQNNTVLSIYFDKEQNAWLGLDTGIDYVELNSHIYSLFGMNSSYGTGYASVLDGSTLYLGTNQGLYRTSYPFQSSSDPLRLQAILGMKSQVWSLEKINNSIFCGNDQGLHIITNGRVKQIDGINGTWRVKPLKSHPNYLLGASYNGFFLLKRIGDGWGLSHHLKGFNESGGMFEEDSEGRIWFCHWQKGVYLLTLSEDMQQLQILKHYNHTNGLPHTENNTINKIQNNIYISTASGIFSVNKGLQLTLENPIHPIFSGYKHSLHISTSPTGELWAAAPNYFAIASKTTSGAYTLDSISMRPLIGKINLGFENLYFISPKEIIISNEDGFTWVCSDNITPMRNDFKTFINCVYTTNPVDALIGGNYEEHAQSTPPQISYRDHSIRFEFTATEFRYDENVEFSYNLIGVDDQWSEYSSSRQKEYTKLTEGTYTFSIRARNLLDMRVAEDSFTFTILPPWYRSLWAYIVYIILGFAATTFLFIWIKTKSNRGAVEMEKKKEMEIKEKSQEIKLLKNQKLQYELKHKSQELANTTMSIINKNEILADISQKLDTLKLELSQISNYQEVDSKIQRMQSSIKNNIDSENSWKKFSENFDIVYQDYLKRLEKAHPKLTLVDKKLCAYLKMNLRSKEIAPLLNMTTRSVEMGRYRLRQKLGLDKDDNLQEYLQKF